MLLPTIFWGIFDFCSQIDDEREYVQKVCREDNPGRNLPTQYFVGMCAIICNAKLGYC